MKFRHISVENSSTRALAWVFFDVQVDFPLREGIVGRVREGLNHRLPVTAGVERRFGDTLRVFVPLDYYELGKQAVREVVEELEASYRDFKRLAIWLEDERDVG